MKTKKQLPFNTPTVLLNYRGVSLLVALVVLSNVFTFLIGFRKNNANNHPKAVTEELYLLDQAKIYVYNVSAFSKKVEEVSQKLDIPPEWLMAVMHSESRFDASVKNQKGSGATGLIQFMPETAKELEITTEKLRNMNHAEQLDFVYEYLDAKRRRYNKSFKSLTDLYLAILYPKAMEGDFCYSLYAKPSEAYRMNSGLDENNDGTVTVQDIDRRMKRIYPTAYEARLGQKGWLGAIF